LEVVVEEEMEEAGLVVGVTEVEEKEEVAGVARMEVTMVATMVRVVVRLETVEEWVVLLQAKMEEVVVVVVVSEGEEKEEVGMVEEETMAPVVVVDLARVTVVDWRVKEVREVELPLVGMMVWAEGVSEMVAPVVEVYLVMEMAVVMVLVELEKVVGVVVYSGLVVKVEAEVGGSVVLNLEEMVVKVEKMVVVQEEYLEGV
jgi:hypothetical protein